ncbi:HAD hydrolase-like protein, partial [Pseudomonas aeruginosa]
QQPADYVHQLTAAFNADPFRVVYTQAQLLAIRRRFPEMRLGLFTRSPRTYALTLLSLAYPNVAWETVVAFEDVNRTKPHGDGIHLAMRVSGVNSVSNVWLVGDGVVDIRAAYDAGCNCVLDMTTWPARHRPEDWRALERVPDAVIEDADDLEEVLDHSINHLPAAERLQAVNGGEGLPGLRFEKTGYFNPLVEGNRPTYIHSLGRHFSGEAPRRVAWHAVTNDIHRMKDLLVVPDYWIQAMRAFIRGMVINRNPAGALAMSSVVITVVPAKPDRVQRLEAMLLQLAQSHADAPIGRGAIAFIPRIMEYLPGALSHHSNGGLNRNQRFANVRDHLRVVADSGYARRHVVVIDDVVTSGASLIYADKYLREAGASDVTLLALTKNVGIR